MSGKTIVILGAGVGGLVAANELRRLLPEEHRIILVDKNIQHTFAPSFLWLMTGDRSKAQITRNLKQLVRPGIEVVHGFILAIDEANRTVKTSLQKLADNDRTVEAEKRSINYDYLVVALGAELAPETIPGLEESAHSFYTLEGAEKLHQALQAFQGGKVAVVVSSLPYKCPGAPHEGAMLIANYLRQRNQHGQVEVHLFTPEPLPMPVAGPALGDLVKGMLQDKGVSFHPLHKLTKVDGASHELSFEGKESIPYDLLVAIPPHRSPKVVHDSGLTNAAGWIPVDRYTLKTEIENIYALGDVTAVSLPGRWKPDVPLMLPKAGVFAHAQAEVVAHRIAAEINGTNPENTFAGSGYCMLEAGEGKAGFAYGNFFAEPAPQLNLHRTGRNWHLGKVLFEQWWLSPQGAKRETLHLALTLGAKIQGIKALV